MNGYVSPLVAAALVVALLGVAAAGVVLAGEDDSETLPGEQLSGVVGVGHAEHEADLEARAFGNAVAAAETDEERADVIAKRLERNEERLDALEDRQAELREQREAGELAAGEYRAKVAVTVAETETVNRSTAQAAEAAVGLPDDVREERGIDTESIRALQERAAELSGPEVAEIARGIAGDRPGAPAGPDDRPGAGEQRSDGADRGTEVEPDRADDESDRADDESDRADDESDRRTGARLGGPATDR